jgi:hypothetical protein
MVRKPLLFALLLAVIGAGLTNVATADAAPPVIIKTLISDEVVDPEGNQTTTLHVEKLATNESAARINVTLPKAMAAHVDVQGVEHRVTEGEQTTTHSFLYRNPRPPALAAGTGLPAHSRPCAASKAASRTDSPFCKGLGRPQSGEFPNSAPAPRQHSLPTSGEKLYIRYTTGAVAGRVALIASGQRCT